MGAAACSNGARSLRHDSDGDGMKRRVILASLASGTAAASGCVRSLSSADGNERPTDGDDSTGSDDANQPVDPPDDGGQQPSGDSSPIPEASGECGPASIPLSERLVPHGGPECSEDREPSFQIANERDEEFDGTVTIVREDEQHFEQRYSLFPGERRSNRTGIPSRLMESVTVTTPTGDEFSASWPGQSCRMHGLAIGRDSIEAGYLEPLHGAADASLACYVGTRERIRLNNQRTENVSVTVSIVNHCDETIESLTWETDNQGFRWLDLSVERGEAATIVADVEGGGAASFDFEGECGVPQVEIPDEEPVAVDTVGIY